MSTLRVWDSTGHGYDESVRSRRGFFAPAAPDEAGLTLEEIHVLIGGDWETLRLVLRDEVRSGCVHKAGGRYSLNGKLPDDVKRALLSIGLADDRRWHAATQVSRDPGLRRRHRSRHDAAVGRVSGLTLAWDGRRWTSAWAVVGEEARRGGESKRRPGCPARSRHRGRFCNVLFDRPGSLLIRSSCHYGQPGASWSSILKTGGLACGETNVP